MKKYIIAFAIIALIIPLLSLTVFASVDNGTILDGIWDFVSDIIFVIVDTAMDIIHTISNGIRTIGGFFSDLIKAIGNGISYLLNGLLSGLKALFIPRDDYFVTIQNRIHKAISKKFGGFVYLVGYMKDSFSRLGVYGKTSELLIMKFPENHLLGGFGIDFLSFGIDFIPMIRLVFTGMITLTTVALCYRKVMSLINT